MVESTDRTRIGLTLTRVYLEALDHLVDEGIYMEHQDAIRDSLRKTFRAYGLETFTDKETEPEADDPP